jgi:hypothetical protein
MATLKITALFVLPKTQVTWNTQGYLDTLNLDVLIHQSKLADFVLFTNPEFPKKLMVVNIKSLRQF